MRPLLLGDVDMKDDVIILKQFCEKLHIGAYDTRFGIY
jgi:hypothetical protein